MTFFFYSMHCFWFSGWRLRKKAAHLAYIMQKISIFINAKRKLNFENMRLTCFRLISCALKPRTNSSNNNDDYDGRTEEVEYKVILIENDFHRSHFDDLN